MPAAIVAVNVAGNTIVHAGHCVGKYPNSDVDRFVKLCGPGARTQRHDPAPLADENTPITCRNCLTRPEVREHNARLGPVADVRASVPAEPDPALLVALHEAIEQMERSRIARDNTIRALAASMTGRAIAAEADLSVQRISQILKQRERSVTASRPPGT